MLGMARDGVGTRDVRDAMNGYGWMLGIVWRIEMGMDAMDPIDGQGC